MAKERGWWDLNVNVELDDIDRDHISNAIKQGFTAGEICKTENDDDD